jgi:hypothetical protein
VGAMTCYPNRCASVHHPNTIIVNWLMLQVAFEPESLPSVSVVSDAPASWAGDLLAVAVTEEDLASSGERQQPLQRQCTAARAAYNSSAAHTAAMSSA